MCASYIKLYHVSCNEGLQCFLPNPYLFTTMNLILSLCLLQPLSTIYGVSRKSQTKIASGHSSSSSRWHIGCLDKKNALIWYALVYKRSFVSVSLETISEASKTIFPDLEKELQELITDNPTRWLTQTKSLWPQQQIMMTTKVSCLALTVVHQSWLTNMLHSNRGEFPKKFLQFFQLIALCK